jgi:cellulose synthase/poly-beta-1,6-N-acetylglucosamine synthase-like glycosyltransferase
MKMTVLVTTYHRTKDLARCLEALKQQTRPADEVLVVVRDTDAETWLFLAAFNAEPMPMRTLTVVVPGAIAALNTGLDSAEGEIISITDDDAAPHPNWLERIETYFLGDDRIGGVGGRDFVYYGSQESWLIEGERKTVGKLQWYGLVIGNHHLGIGEPREVDVLKGANMSYRRAAIGNRRFDRRMRGSGAQVHYEVEFCLALKQKGWKLIYDPAVAVNHYNADRFDEDQRGKFSDIALMNLTHNETLALLEHLPFFQRIMFLMVVTLVGTRSTPGFLQWLRLLPSERNLAGQKLLACQRGRWQGWQTWQRSLMQKTQTKTIYRKGN